ncbi:MAG: VOC family protein [Halobacteriaceae archaeon]
MSELPKSKVNASRPDSPFHCQGTDHVTVEGTNIEDTIEFYRDILGMSLVLKQPNLDRKELTHLFFDTGDGRLITFFVNENRDSTEIQSPNPGQVHHLAFRIDGGQLNDIINALEDAGHPVSEFDRGAFHSLYTRDNNGLGIELVADKFAIPDERRGEVMALAHQLRVESEDNFVKEEHMAEAMEQLGLDVQKTELKDAQSGQDF